MNRPTITLAFFILAVVEAILLIFKYDYSLALEQENERLRAQIPAPKKDVYEVILCGPDWRYSILQRKDKRRENGIIYRSRWEGECI